MAVLVYDQPESYSLAYNDNPYVVRSTANNPTQRFEMIVVSESLQQISTERVFTRQGVSQNGSITTDRTYYDPSRILQSQLNPVIAIPSVDHAGYFDAVSMYYKYYLTVWEEIQNAQGVYERTNVWISNLKTVWNGVRNTRDWLSFDYTDYDHATGSTNLALTDAPRTQYIDDNQSAFLYFLNSGESTTSCRFTSYDSNGSSLVDSILTISQSAPFGYIPVGTYDLDNADASNWTVDPATLLTGASYYTVTIGDGVTYTFRINQRCSKYTPIRLHWLNRLGGFDSFNFSLKSMEETEIDRRSYRQQHHNFTGTRWQYSQSSRGLTDYFVGTSDKLTVNTPYLTEDESVWMNDFATSPLVYQELNNELIAMSGKPKLIKKQTSLNDKLMQYEFELEYSLNNIRQRG